MASHGIAGEQSPVWLAAALLGVGVASWVGAGASAHAEWKAQPKDESKDESKDEPVVSAAATVENVAPAGSATEVHVAESAANPLAPRPAPAEPTVVAQPVAAAEPCAPTVELQFSAGASEVADADALRTIVAAAREFEDRKVIVEGYASATGSPERNLELSHRRASKAKSKLVARGVAAKRVSVQAFGEYRPNLEGDEDRDRRVVIKLEGMPECPAGEGDE